MSERRHKSKVADSSSERLHSEAGRQSKWLAKLENRKRRPSKQERMIICPHTGEKLVNHLALYSAPDYGPCRHTEHDASAKCRRNIFTSETVAGAEKLKLEEGGYAWYEAQQWATTFCYISCGWRDAREIYYAQKEASEDPAKWATLMAMISHNVEFFARHVNRFSRVCIDYIENYKHYNPAREVPHSLEELLEEVIYGGRYKIFEAETPARQVAIDSLLNFFELTKLLSAQQRENVRQQFEDNVVESGWGQIQYEQDHAHPASKCMICESVGQPTPGYYYRGVFLENNFLNSLDPESSLARAGENMR